MKSLYKINQAYLNIINELEDNGGELTPEIEQGLKINKEELEVKTLNYIEFIGDRKSFINRIDEEIKRLQSIKKANTNLVERLEDNIKQAVYLYGEYEADTRKISLRKSEQVDIEDESKIPAEFIKVKTEVMKAEVKKALKEGKEVPGAKIIVNKNLFIK